MRLLSFMALSLALAVSFPPGLSAWAAQPEAPKAASQETDFQNWLKALEADGAKTSVGSIQTDTARNTVTVTDLKIVPAAAGDAQAASPELSVSKLELDSFSAEDKGYRFSAARADKLAYGLAASPANSLTLEHLDLGASFLPSIKDFRSDPVRPVTSHVRFLSLLSNASVKSTAAEKLAVGTGFTADRLTMGEIAGGRIGEIALQGLATHWPIPADGGSPQTGTFTTADIVAKTIDLSAYIQLFDEDAYLSAGASRPWKNLIESIVVKQVDFQDGGTSLRFAGAELGALKVRQFPQNITAIFDKIARDPTYIESPANAGDAQILATAVRQSFAFEKAAVTDLGIKIPNAAGKLSIDLGSASLANLTATHIDQLQAGTLRVTDDGGSIGLQSLQLSGINLVASTQATASGVSQPVFTTPTVDRVSAAGLEARTGEVSFGFDTIDLAMSYFIGAVPTNVNAAIKHFKLPVAQIANPGLRQSLTDLGYMTVDLSLDLSAAWQDSASAVAFDTLRITGADMGTVNLSGALTGISRSTLENPAEMLGPQLAAAGVQNFRMSFENASLFDRFIVQLAKANNTTPDELKKILSTNMPAILAQIPVTGIRNKFVFAAVSFLNNPKILELASATSEVTPLQTVIAAFGEPSKLPVILKLDASANNRK